MLGSAGELGDKENSVYGEKADIMFAGDDTKGDSSAIVDERSCGSSRGSSLGEEASKDIYGAPPSEPTPPSLDWERSSKLEAEVLVRVVEAEDSSSVATCGRPGWLAVDRSRTNPKIVAPTEYRDWQL